MNTSQAATAAAVAGQRSNPHAQDKVRKDRAGHGRSGQGRLDLPLQHALLKVLQLLQLLGALLSLNKRGICNRRAISEKTRLKYIIYIYI